MNIGKPPTAFGYRVRPPLFHGLHRSRRQIAKTKPFADPWTETDSKAYAEQLGWKRQLGGNRGETANW